MTASYSGYIIGLGSNIEPFDNISRAIDQLLTIFGEIHISTVLTIPPIGMNSSQNFLNAVLFIETTLSEPELKQHCNRIEESLGRDRSDPKRKIKDRPIDIDILAPATFPDDADRKTNSITDEYFLYPLIDDLSIFLLGNTSPLLQQGEDIKVGKLSFGQSATTINRNADTRYEGVW